MLIRARNEVCVPLASLPLFWTLRSNSSHHLRPSHLHPQLGPSCLYFKSCCPDIFFVFPAVLQFTTTPVEYYLIFFTGSEIATIVKVLLEGSNKLLRSTVTTCLNLVIPAALSLLSTVMQI